MKAGRCHIDVEEEHKEVEERKRNEPSQDELPPVFMTVRTLYTTEVVGEYKWTMTFCTVTTQQACSIEISAEGVI